MKKDYIHFCSKSIKARLSWIQKVLDIPITCKRDKTTVKALKKFQVNNGLVGNAIVDEKTYNLLYDNGGKNYNIDNKEK